MDKVRVVDKGMVYSRCYEVFSPVWDYPVYELDNEGMGLYGWFGFMIYPEGSA